MRRFRSVPALWHKLSNSKRVRWPMAILAVFLVVTCVNTALETPPDPLSSSGNVIPVIIDCTGTAQDGYALVLAGSVRGLDVRGVTTVYGDLPAGAASAQRSIAGCRSPPPAMTSVSSPSPNIAINRASRPPSSPEPTAPATCRRSKICPAPIPEPYPSRCLSAFFAPKRLRHGHGPTPLPLFSSGGAATALQLPTAVLLQRLRPASTSAFVCRARTPSFCQSFCQEIGTSAVWMAVGAECT